MVDLYTAVLRAVLPCPHEKITIFRGALYSKLDTRLTQIEERNAINIRKLLISQLPCYRANQHRGYKNWLTPRIRIV